MELDFNDTEQMQNLLSIKAEGKRREYERDSAIIETAGTVEELNQQLSEARAHLEETRKQCDLLNKQFLEYQLDSQKRDIDNAKSAQIANWIAIIGVIIAYASLVVAVIALFL